MQTACGSQIAISPRRVSKQASLNRSRTESVNVFALQLLQSRHQRPGRVVAAVTFLCRPATALDEPAGCLVGLGGDQEPKAVSIVSRCFLQPVEAREPCLDSVPTRAVLVHLNPVARDTDALHCYGRWAWRAAVAPLQHPDAAWLQTETATRRPTDERFTRCRAGNWADLRRWLAWQGCCL